MKIRIKGNFIRYRLTKSEVKTLADTGKIVEETCFGPEESHIFRYALETKDGIDGLQADFKNNTITLYLSAGAAKVWPDEERVGFENQVNVAPDQTITLLLEKDFICMDQTAEDQSDNYPHP